MNFPSVTNFSVAKGTGGTTPPELYIPLWWYSGSVGSQSAYTTAGSAFIGRGSTSNNFTYAHTSAKLYTLNSSWLPTLKFALEVSMYSTNSSGAYAELWDLTTNSVVNGSSISTTAVSTASVIRSGQFTLIPGHIYGITTWVNAASYSCAVTDASLIVFPS
jgi:hypothetical protein